MKLNASKNKIHLVQLLLLVVILTFVSCSQDSINNQPKTKLFFQDLPDTVQKLYISFETAKDSVVGQHGIHYTCYGCHRDTIICLDENFKKVYHKRKLSGFDHEKEVGNYLFFDNQTFFLASVEFPYENTPFIFYKKQLYFLASVNLISTDDVKNAQYGKYDLTALFK